MKSIRISGNVIDSKRQTIASYDAIAIKIEKQGGHISRDKIYVLLIHANTGCMVIDLNHILHFVYKHSGSRIA